ncbi:MAG TPA: flavodoxin domain-containing protein [Candidatus Omnitrophota bacterium]|nr:flavodoxin domain-containing protein [Candidatus Omnitrophota bacterium]HRZ15480.1 flavodoxin domain-containing protein [Candidatus Omnitrophota bacterium]
MARILIVYYSRSGNTRKMAELIAEGAEKQGGVVTVKDVKAVAAKELIEFDALIIGSPAYYGTMAAPLKQLLDDSVSLHGKLDGKIGGAFCSSANIAGGNETTILDILNALLIHGMILQGDPQGDHYGPVAIGAPDHRASKECLRFGSRIAALTMKLHG